MRIRYDVLVNNRKVSSVAKETRHTTAVQACEVANLIAFAVAGKRTKVFVWSRSTTALSWTSHEHDITVSIYRVEVQSCG